MKTSHSADTWELFRAQMPIVGRWSYFDNAAVSPLSVPARDAIQLWLTQASEDGDTRWSEWVRGMHQARAAAARLINADPAEVAFVANTTAGVNLVAEGYPWRDGDNVVTLANEFPANQYPWLNLAQRGVATRRVPVDSAEVDLQRVADAMDQRTRILSVSWVGYATGWRLDLDEVVELAHSRGVLLFVDAIQGLGVFPLDVRRTPVDFLAADGHKWLLGPEGAGVCYLRREHLELLRPIGLGWNSVVHASDYARIELNLRPEAARYEGGSHNLAGLLGLGGSLQLLASLGLASTHSTIADRVLELTDIACERLAGIGARILSERSGPHRSGIVAFEFPGRDPQAIRKHCLAQRVVLACRGGKLRISPHAYANEDDIERLIRALMDATRK
jgi:selenocysteine lyase/cysteine desulfurase